MIRTDLHRHRTPWANRACLVCGSKAIGINFGAATCAPCKAFFRRNARRDEILHSLCQHLDKKSSKGKKNDVHEKKLRDLQIRRCSSCRLRRCFEVGMKEELIRTDRENERHRELVNTNRKRKELLKQQQQENQLAIPQTSMDKSDLLSEMDWCHLSNIVSAYDTCCLKTYVEQRAKIFINGIPEQERTIKDYIVLPISVILSLSSFIRSLPAFQSLSRSVQSFLCKNNLRRLIFVNFHELNQSCFSEPWQVAAHKTCWQSMCGPELYPQFAQTEKLAEKLWIADPIVTRLWLVTLFFSTPLFSYYDSTSSTIQMKRKVPHINIQNAYVTLLWKYLLHRHGFIESVRIYSNLVHVFLHMLRIGVDISLRIRTQKQLLVTHEVFDQLTTVNINHAQWKQGIAIEIP